MEVLTKEEMFLKKFDELKELEQEVYDYWLKLRKTVEYRTVFKEGV